MNMKRVIVIISLFCSLVAMLMASCTGANEQPASTSAHAEWAYDAVVYEMNVRQQSAEGSFAAAEARLPFLKELGVDIVWLMPIHPIGELGRKGTLGSYYAIRNYYEVNPEFGTMEDFESFLAKAHELDMRVILDYVANHTSPDAAWVTEKPAEWYVRDSTGKPIVQYDWTDISKLNYECEEVHAAMYDVLKFWIEKGVDGFRCDVAGEVPDAYWTKAWAELKKLNPDIYLLAEGEGVNFHTDGFDATYGWKLLHIMNDIAKGDKTTADLKAWIAEFTSEYPREAFRLLFTSNHDENSWSGTEFERYGEGAETFAAMTYVLPQAQPLIYTGQEVGYDHRFAFFEKDPIPGWEPNRWTDFYKKLNAMRHSNVALASGERGGELVYVEGAPESVLAFSREVEQNKVVSLFNFSEEAASVVVTAAIAGEYTNAISGEKVTLVADEQIDLAAWGYMILTK